MFACKVKVLPTAHVSAGGRCFASQQSCKIITRAVRALLQMAAAHMQHRCCSWRALACYPLAGERMLAHRAFAERSREDGAGTPQKDLRASRDAVREAPRDSWSQVQMGPRDQTDLRRASGRGDLQGSWGGELSAGGVPRGSSGGNAAGGGPGSAAEEDLSCWAGAAGAAGTCAGEAGLAWPAGAVRGLLGCRPAQHSPAHHPNSKCKVVD